MYDCSTSNDSKDHVKITALPRRAVPYGPKVVLNHTRALWLKLGVFIHVYLQIRTCTCSYENDVKACVKLKLSVHVRLECVYHPGIKTPGARETCVWSPLRETRIHDTTWYYFLNLKIFFYKRVFSYCVYTTVRFDRYK